MSTDKYIRLKLVNEIFGSQNWVFAKTMKNNPHWYCLGKKFSSKDDYALCVETIEQYGEIEYFYNKPYTILRINGWKYWVMDSIFDEPKALINKAVAHSRNQYCLSASRYDNYYSTHDYQKENTELSKRIHVNYLRGRVLDIGAGTGILLDLFKIFAPNYVGVDASKDMCSQFKRKHPNHCIFNCRYEDFTLEGFDSILALYGVFSYVPPDYLPTILDKLNPGGRYFLMFYADTYKHLQTDLVKTENTYLFEEYREYLPEKSFLISQWRDYFVLEGRRDA